MLNFQHKQIHDFLLNPLLLLVIGLFSLSLLSRWLHKPNGRKCLPPSPPKLPILGNLHQLTALTHRSLQSLGRRYGPVMLLHFGNRPVIIVQSAVAAMEIMKTNDLIFADKPNSSTTRRLFYDLKDITVAPYGEYWRKLKSICILQLLNHKKVQSFGSIMDEETALFVEKIKSCSSCRSPVNFTEMFVSFANDVICRSALGRKYSEGEVGKKFCMLFQELLQVLGSFNVGEYIPCLWWINRVNGFDARVDKVAKQLDDFLEKVIQEHLNRGMGNMDAVNGENRENFVDILLKMYLDNTTGVSIDRESIKAIILDILAGGTDTTSAALEWAMTELLRHPIVLTKLQNEVRDVLKDRKDITDNDLEKMPYLKAVLRETLRYHTPIPFLAREARHNVKIMRYELAAGTMVIINAWAIGRDPESWNEPDKFQPERFLNTSIDYKGQDFGLIPFGSGRRSCPGAAFAMASVELVLANLVHKFEWELPNGMKGQDLDIDELPGITIHRKHPLFAVATQCHFQ